MNTDTNRIIDNTYKKVFSIRERLFTLYQDFIETSFPITCAGCDNTLLKGEEQICTECRLSISYSESVKKITENEMHNKFKGKTNLYQASSLFYFYKNSNVQRIIHSIKYRNNPALASYLGQWHGLSILHHHPNIDKPDGIVYVPMHPIKYARKGYNHAEEYAKGLADVLQVPILHEVLIKQKLSGSQTKNQKLLRWMSAEEQYIEGDNISMVTDKQIWLVDDVITTGATIIACSDILWRYHIKKLSVMSIALAKNRN